MVQLAPTKNFKQEAIADLTELRKGSKFHESLTNHVRNCAKEGEFTLSDVGTSEEELELLRVKGCKVRALIWLDYLKGHMTSKLTSELAEKARPMLPSLIEDELKLGGLTYEDLGVTREEVESLVHGDKLHDVSSENLQ